MAESLTESLRVDRLYKAFGGSPVLEGLSFSIQAGDIVGIIGRSGAGKTTLLRCLHGAETPDAGDVFIEGQEIGRLKEKELLAVRRRIGMVFQNFNLLKSRTVWGNISLALEIAGISKSARIARIQELIGLVGLEGHENKHPSQLSGGQKQRVGIARALATNPAVLLCDEATSALDPETTSSILALLSKINQELSITIVLITHEMDVIHRLARRVMVLEQGRIMEDARIEHFSGTKEKHALTQFFEGEEQSVLSGQRLSAIQNEKPHGGLPALRVTVAESALFTSLIPALYEQFSITSQVLRVNLNENYSDTGATHFVILSRDDENALNWLVQNVEKMEVLGYVPSGI
ncbi:methionine ABC transporter ATP-binding protein [Acetobacter persici]|uniref:Cell division ATP-binding protein FtsE n=1 Tax=Acetobacter persici TaxID=1076596 RepID=A0A6V8IBU1_9PROT|nr:methionine ABC transporter ATP-binding protein [Acetobacter persici]OUI89992.1 dioxygenase [Acetobacter persici]GFE94537.1 methionine import ATP-binding protein MetN 2 [Acetobacter persici]